MAKRLGFNNFGEFHLWIKEKQEEGYTHRETSELVGKYKDFIWMTVKGVDLDKAKKEMENKDLYQDKLRRMVASGCSLYYACELMGLEIPSGRILLGDYNKEMERGYRAALKAGLSKDELEKRIVQIILDSPDGKGYKVAAKELNVGGEVVRRYLARYLKKNLPYPEL